MLKTKIIVIIFIFCFAIIMSGEILRVTQYGLYGSKETWEETVQLPIRINYPYGTSEYDAKIRYGSNASEYLIYERNFINLTKRGEAEGLIKCYPDQNVCHFTGRGNYPYGAFSEWTQSSDYFGWLNIIFKCVIQALVLTVLIGIVYEIIKKYYK